MATFAVVTDGADRATVGALRAAGAEVVGLLGPDPFDSLAWSAAEDVQRCYPDLGELLRDSTDAVCVDDAGPSAVHVTRAALRAGRHVLLSRPVTVERELLEVADSSTLVTAVAMRTRAWPGASAVAQALPFLDLITQVTVVGWPHDDRLELIDVVRRWCGDIVAVCASPAAMPATSLAGRPVTLALLTATGATVLVAEDPEDAPSRTPVITLVGTAGRVVVAGSRLQRQATADGQTLPELVLPDPGHPLREAAVGVLRALRGGPLDADLDPADGVATLRDVLAAAHVIAAAEASVDAGDWEEL
jgi:predicted dehydrogenase